GFASESVRARGGTSGASVRTRTVQSENGKAVPRALHHHRVGPAARVRPVEDGLPGPAAVARAFPVLSHPPAVHRSPGDALAAGAIAGRGARQHHSPAHQSPAQLQDPAVVVDPDLMPLPGRRFVEVERRAAASPRSGPPLDQGASVGCLLDQVRAGDAAVRPGDIPGAEPEIELPVGGSHATSGQGASWGDAHEDETDENAEGADGPVSHDETPPKSAPAYGTADTGPPWSSTPPSEVSRCSAACNRAGVRFHAGARLARTPRGVAPHPPETQARPHDLR